MLEKILELMKDYENAKSPYGPILLVLRSDLSGFFDFTVLTMASVQIKFVSLDDAIVQWYKVFSYKEKHNQTTK